MADMLNNAVSGLLSFQRALSTTSHNIANVNTEGYSRQRVELNTRYPTAIGGTFVGSGVEITTIQRTYDQFITNSVRESNASYYRLEKFTDLTSQIDNLLADPQGGISPLLQEFFASVQDVSDDPASGTARYQLINTAESLVNRFSAFDTRLEQLTNNTETDIRTTVDEVNQLINSIADVNIALEEINASGVLTQQSSDLLDKRDALLNQLSKRISIQVINEPQNNITVQIGNGQTMLSGTTAFSLSVRPDDADPTQSIIVYNGFSTDNDISGQLTGGELGGLLEYRSTVLNPSKNALGRVAIGLADSFNEQHRDGMDLQGALGTDFFSFAQPRSIPYTSNTGTATLTTTVTDVSQLTVDDYTLYFDGATWTVTSSSGSSGTLALPTDTFEGLTFTFAGGAAVAGDRFNVKPTAEGARTIDVLISDPNQIAAAFPIRTDSSLQNLGNVEISPGIVTDVTDPNLLQTATLTFNNPPTTFDVVVGGVTVAAGVAYSNNMTYTLNGWEVTLQGVPQANDQFTVEANTNGSGDNRNALALTNLQTTGLFDNNVNNYQEAYSSLVGRVGSLTYTAMVDRDAQQALLSQAEDKRNEIAGVNLDEEAADLIKYQQAYEAAARVITTTQTLFESLINSLR